MVSGMEFLKKVVLPVGLVGMLLVFFKPLYMAGGELNYFGRDSIWNAADVSVDRSAKS